MPLQRADRESSQVCAAIGGPVFCGQLRQRRACDADTLGDRRRAQRPRLRTAVVGAGDAVGCGRPPDSFAAQVEPTRRAVAQLRHPAHQAVHPQAEVGDR